MKLAIAVILSASGIAQAWVTPGAARTSTALNAGVYYSTSTGNTETIAGYIAGDRTNIHCSQRWCILLYLHRKHRDHCRIYRWRSHEHPLLSTLVYTTLPPQETPRPLQDISLRPQDAEMLRILVMHPMMPSLELTTLL